MTVRIGQTNLRITRVDDFEKYWYHWFKSQTLDSDTQLSRDVLLTMIDSQFRYLRNLLFKQKSVTNLYHQDLEDIHQSVLLYFLIMLDNKNQVYLYRRAPLMYILRQLIKSFFFYYYKIRNYQNKHYFMGLEVQKEFPKDMEFLEEYTKYSLIDLIYDYEPVNYFNLSKEVLFDIMKELLTPPYLRFGRKAFIEVANKHAGMNRVKLQIIAAFYRIDIKQFLLDGGKNVT